MHVLSTHAWSCVYDAGGGRGGVHEPAAHLFSSAITKISAIDCRFSLLSPDDEKIMCVYVFLSVCVHVCVWMCVRVCV